MLRRLFTSASRPLLKDFVSKVPGMGDSITEGSLIKLVAKVGALVKQDEIVAVIETDKVSVDVRSPHPGLLKAFHAALNDTVAVGAPLFTLDTDSSAAATAGSGSSSSSSNSSSASSSPGSSSSSSASAHLTPPFNPQEAASSLRSVATQGISDAATITHSPQQHRKPSINFRHGVRAPPSAGSAAGSSSGGARPSGSAAVGDYTASLEAQHPSRKGALPELSVSPSFGRPPINGDQEFLIFSGGAYGAPPPPPPAKAPKK